jgi:deoxyribonuclease-4
MRFGFHVSIGGGLANAVSEAELRKCQTIQIFSRNPQGWKYKELDPDQVARFRQGIRENDICPVTVHMPYLANIASPNKALYRKSIESVAVDLKRCARIGAQYLVIHLGRSRAASEDELATRMAQAIDAAYRRAARGAPSAELPKLLLENTAGMGAEFRQLKVVIEGATNSNRLGVVLDTAHLFEAGWDLRIREGLNRMLREFDATVGMKRLYLLHLNDSKTDLGSHLDRHWHIGQGKIGRGGFRHIVNHPLLSHLPGIMETPRLGIREDRMNLRAIRALAAGR